MFDEEQPYALRGGGDSRTNRTTKNNKKPIRLKAETQETLWATTSADTGLSPQDQSESEDSSSNSSSCEDWAYLQGKERWNLMM